MFNNNQDFYPTPLNIIRNMLEKVDFKMIGSVLEPSAGKGDIVSAVIDRFKIAHSACYSREAKWDIDTIEIDENLRYILQGKKYRVVHDDFLTYDTYKKYDIIIMNPPFIEGDKHLLKALEMQEVGGQIICLLNAETLKNPYSNTRKDLVRKLEEYNAEITYHNSSFINAERSTNVEIALIKINIPKVKDDSIILNQLKKQECFTKHQTQYDKSLINADFIKGIIERYNFEAKAGLKLIQEYEALKPLMLSSFKDEYNKNPILELKLHYDDKDGNCTLENSYIKQIRMKYWKALFTSEQFIGLFTSNLREKYLAKVDELRNYDFSFYNIYTIRIQLNKEMIQAVEDTILKLFEEFSNKHHWYDEMSKNIHYYNGWKTNKAWKINKKVIIPLNAFSSWSGNLDYSYRVREKLSDIEKVFNYLDIGSDEIDLISTLDYAQKNGETKKIKLKYFLVTFFKKGTCHIEFTNEDLLQKFNLFGSQRMGWLPPSYSKKRYKDMTPEEKSVIDDFEGEASYNKVMLNKDYYIVESSKLLMLA